MKGLTRRQELFVAEYLTDLNATRAYIAAGYARQGADAGAARLLVNVRVAEEISKKHSKRLATLEITADRVLQELAKLAFYDPINFFEDGRHPEAIAKPGRAHAHGAGRYRGSGAG